MNIGNRMRKQLLTFGLVFLIGMSMSACGTSTTTWKEEVLLHDGSKLVVERWQITDPSAPRELGQPPSRIEEGTRFVVPGTSQPIAWKSNFGRGQEDNLVLLALDFVNSTPYIVTFPVRCHAYNKWGRPNPPYVYFKFDGKVWQRITLEELPSVFQNANVIIGGYNEPKLSAEERKSSVLTVQTVQEQNRLSRPEYLRVFTREPVPSSMLCEELVYYKGSWIMPNDPIARSILDRRAK